MKNLTKAAVLLSVMLVAVGCSKPSAETTAPAPTASVTTTSASIAHTAASAGGCAPGHVLSRLVTGPKCMKSCSKSSDCGKGWDCASAPLSGQSGMAKVCFDQNDN